MFDSQEDSPEDDPDGLIKAFDIHRLDSPHGARARLDGYPPGVVDRDGGSSGFALRVPPYGDQKVREAVEDRRLVHETLGAVDEPDDLEDLLYPIHGAEPLLELGQTVESSLSRCLVS